MKNLGLKLMVFLVFAASFPLYAATVAYWKADDGTADTLIYTEYDDYRYSQDIDDVSGNGNHVQAWSDTPNNSSFWHRDNIAFSVVPPIFYPLSLPFIEHILPGNFT